jgi:cysteine-rich repeat protein
MRCVSLAQLNACEDKEENEACKLAGVAEALCSDGVCTALTCGDGIVGGDEVCDDGNIRSCDGCSADCRSDESCGNGNVDCSEECDRGEENSDEPNASCRPDCHLQRCGDGIVDTQSGEDCDGAPSATTHCEDFGFYGGTIECSDACRNDTSRCEASCGDGIVNGSEICDALWSTSQSCLDFGYDVGVLTCSPFCTPSFARCEQLGFQTMQLSNVSAFLYDVWGLGPNDVFAFGQNNILHYDGVTWSSTNIDGVDSSGSDLLDFLDGWGASSNDVFTVGYTGLIAHYDGSSWTDMQSGVETTLESVWGAAANDVFAVGYPGTILHFDGTAWTQQTAPDPEREYASVWGTSGDNVFAAHATGIDHFDGTRWRALASPSGRFDGIWGSGPSDIFAVGEAGNVVYFDGATWSTMDQTATTADLFSVSGNGPSDVYASGDRGTIIHYDGAHWAPVSTPTGQAIPSVWSAAANDVFAITSLDILHFGQSGPTLHDMPAGTSEALLAVWITAPDDVTAVGAGGAIVHYDGTAWTQQASLADEDFSGVWGADATHKWATGFRYGAMYQFDGTNWSETAIPTNTPLTAIWGRSATDVYAVGEQGVILHFDGTSWTVEDSGTEASFSSLWGYDDGTVYAGSFGGVLLRRSADSGWHTVLSEPDSDFWGIWGSSPDHLVVAADTHALFLYDEHARAMPLPAGVLVDSISGSGTHDIFGIPVGAVGLQHFDGRDWAPIRVTTGLSAFYDVAMGRDRGYIVGDSGVIVEIDRHCAKHERACSDRWDNDCDGLANCSDPDCKGSPACADGGACAVTTTVACNASFSGSTASGTPSFSIYPCSPRSELGREVFHQFTADESGRIELSLTAAEDADLDLVVLGSAVAGGCDVARECIGASSTMDGTERLTFEARAGDTYYVAVDASEQEKFAAYTLMVACP